jgi:ZIP family zinc transporter
MIPASPNNQRSSADGLHANLACRVGHGGGQLHRVLAKRADDRFLSPTTGLFAGVILYVSFVEIFPKGEVPLAGVGYGDMVAAWFNAAAFFADILTIVLFCNMVPAAENLHEARSHEEV